MTRRRTQWTVAEFNDRVQETILARDAQRWRERRALTVALRRIWRCRQCGAWRHGDDPHTCPQATS